MKRIIITTEHGIKIISDFDNKLPSIQFKVHDFDGNDGIFILDIPKSDFEKLINLYLKFADVAQENNENKNNSQSRQ